jgi:hypothetical protein
MTVVFNERVSTNRPYSGRQPRRSDKAADAFADGVETDG